MPRNLALFLASAALLSGADADLILYNGKIVTVDGRFSIQQAVAVRGGRVSAVGSSDPSVYMSSAYIARRPNETGLVMGTAACWGDLCAKDERGGSNHLSGSDAT